MSDPVWTDSHCHLEPEDDDGVAEAHGAGVARLINVGTDVTTSRAALELAGRHEGVWATAGVHPHEASSGIEGLDELLADGRAVAVGECGLDYHYDHSPRSVQRQVFAAQIAIANERSLPLVIHSREAWNETFEILDAEGPPESTVFHCFTGGPDEARRALDLGAWLSFSGIVTFPSADEVRAAARLAPLDRVLVETDAPYLAPEPHRGRPNRPALLPAVGSGLAAAKGLDPAAIATATWHNAARAFRLDS